MGSEMPRSMWQSWSAATAGNRSIASLRSHSPSWGRENDGRSSRSTICRSTTRTSRTRCRRASAASRLRSRRADGVLFVTPEHNRSIPAVLKNAIDWGTRPYGQNVWTGKPAAITGTSPGAIASAIAQQHLRQVLGNSGRARAGRRGLHHLQAGPDRRSGRRRRRGHAQSSCNLSSTSSRRSCPA